MSESHSPVGTPSDWVRRFASRIPRHGAVLDVACGGGRHSRLLAGCGHRVVAVDRNAEAIGQLAGVMGVDARVADLESEPWPFPGERFAGIVVTNYLHRALLPTLVESLAPGGVLIYETFALGNERFGRPSNPAFLLRPGELLAAVRGRLRVIAYEDLEVALPRPAMVQRICAERAAEADRG